MTAARRDHKHAMPTNPAASTSAAGLAPQATAPAAGLRNVVGIDNGESAYTNKALFDATSPTTQAFGDAAAVGTAMTVPRIDHKHAMPTAGIANGNAVKIDAADVADNDYAKFTANGLEGRSAAEVKADLDLEPDVDIASSSLIAGLTSGGVVTGGVVTANGTPDQAVDVSACEYITDEGKRYSLAAVDNLAAAAADATNPRIDIIYGSGAGVITYLAGTAAATPAQPSTPAHGVLLAAIARAANDNTIAQTDITAMRSYVRPYVPPVNTDAAPALGGLCHNAEYRCTNASPTTAPTMTIPVIPAANAIYYSQVLFKAPNATAPVVTNKSAYTIKYKGRSTSADVFTPVAGVWYLMSFEFKGAYILCWITEA